MKIMVFDVPAEEGGALSILKQYYEEATINKENEWYFVLSTPKFDETNNVVTLNYPWIKKSWFHRLFFDYFLAHRLVEKYDISEVLSLQNLIIPRVKVNQTVYLHQSLPFSEKRYRFFENSRFWIYQNIIGALIVKSLRKAHSIIVQTNWMKKACLKKGKINPNKIHVIPPVFDIDGVKKYSFNSEINSKLSLFYPAYPFEYKNHKIIVEALKKVSQFTRDEINVIFTFKGDENKRISTLVQQVKKSNLPVEFVGIIGKEMVFDYYSKSALIFPSYIETFGLPLLEAKMHNCPIIASDCAFSHEILDDYDNVLFFNPHDSDDLKSKIEMYVSKMKG